MKKGNLDKWTDIKSCENLLFFSQLVNELLFDYSIPSNRISTLNSHFLCIDALNAIDSIERKGVPEGTLKPIVEELYVTIEKDPAFKTGASPLKYFVKYQNDKYRVSTNVSELSYEDLKKTVHAINTGFFRDNTYYNTLKNRLIELVENNNVTDQPELFRIVKSLLTELINIGYSSKFIQNTMEILFWNPQKEIKTSSTIRDFFEVFNFSKEKYTVVFVVNKRKIHKFVNNIDGWELVDKLEQITQLHSLILYRS